MGNLTKELLDKDGYSTPILMQKACKNHHFRILLEIFKYCEEKKECIEDHNLLMVELKNEPKNCQGDIYGIFKQNSDVINNKPSWFNGEMAIWFSNNQPWMIGGKSEIQK